MAAPRLGREWESIALLSAPAQLPVRSTTYALRTSERILPVPQVGKRLRAQEERSIGDSFLLIGGRAWRTDVRPSLGGRRWQDHVGRTAPGSRELEEGKDILGAHWTTGCVIKQDRQRSRSVIFDRSGDCFFLNGCGSRCGGNDRSWRGSRSRMLSHFHGRCWDHTGQWNFRWLGCRLAKA